MRVVLPKTVALYLNAVVRGVVPSCQDNYQAPPKTGKKWRRNGSSWQDGSAP
jgi:hypothetical protein